MTIDTFGLEPIQGLAWLYVEWLCVLFLILKGIKKIKQREMELFLVERGLLVKWNSEDVEDHIVLTTNDDNLPTAVAVHCINSRRHFTFAAGSVEMANLNAHQLSQQQNVDTFERGMSLFDMYSSEEKDENKIV
jgi:hypothetical protein